MNVNSRILCIDYGTVRVGLALSDPTRTIAQARGFIENNNSNLNQLAAKIANIAKENNVNTILIGLPKKLNGSDGRLSSDVKKIAEYLENEFKLNTVLWDERFSSISAENILIDAGVNRKKRKEKVDSLAAVIILQNYLDFLQNNNENTI
ncbi:MAG TPA: Holliday junction resolvase RuvX [Victivallales bacterium]|nr:Holliday junction resolvase RuvX [Victivallales bacterium]HPO89617.1 Holliday junction resolvase RuvX [Victivallales bacterium]HRR06731.1 Holliday junction resolvase RuvX [Victivallales bacterium]HRU01357.1 Holliday junction resolvase RuvX [Victivallales bacterium]